MKRVDKLVAMVKFPGKLLDPLRKYLLKERDRLLEMQKKLAKEDPYKDTYRQDDNAAIDTDVAEQVDHDRVSAMTQELKRSIINIRKTLTRIKLGKFGSCTKCGSMIDTDRLAIKPTAELCLRCKKEVESSKKHK